MDPRPAPPPNPLGCWSCAHWRAAGCALGREAQFRANAGPRCRGFDYEPGADEAERAPAHT